KISLRRLEQIVKESHAAQRPLPAEVRYLAGLQAVPYVFFYPESGDVVLAGPAEGWKLAASGENVGDRSNRPVLHLADFIVALRFAYGQNRGDSFLGCSIDPTPEGVRRLAAVFKKLGGHLDRSRLPEILATMEQALGPQPVTLYGAPGDSRF